MSNQEKETPRIKRLLKEGKLAYINKATLPSEFTASAQGDQSTIPSEVSYSKSKDTTSSPILQEESTKFSLRELDAPYLDAVERGDMETAQRMVLEAAKLAMPDTKVVDENGNPKVVYRHGKKHPNIVVITEVMVNDGKLSVSIELDDEGNLEYVDKEKALNYLHHSAPIAEALSNPRLISTTKVIQNFENPKIEPRFSLREVNARFNEELATLTEENARERILNVGTPSSILLACGIEDKPIRLYGAKLLSKVRKHGYKIDDLKNLPLALSGPIAVFEGSKKNSFAILTELRIGNNNVLAALSVGKGGHDVDFNIISSVYDKREDSVARWVNDGKMLWVDKKKALDYFSVSAPLAEAQNNQELISTTKVIQNFENAKIEPKSSLREFDAPYLDTVARGDMETAQRHANMLSKFEELYRASASRTTEGQSQSKEKYSLSDEQAATIIEAMKANAVVAPQIELTPENWVAEFGAEGVVSTPIGEVIMGEHQYKKLVDNKRNNDFGKVKPTLTNPDIVLEEHDPKEGALRDTKYLFIKTFTKPNREKVIYFTSVTVKQEGGEVSISSHRIKNEQKLKEKMHNDNVVHLKETLLDSEVRLTKPQSEGSDLVPTPSVISESKDTTSSPIMQEESTKFSLRELDASYLDAVERGDMETAQRMVLEAAKLAMPDTKVVDENDNPKVVYRHSKKHPNIVVITEVMVNDGKLSVSIELDDEGNLEYVDKEKALNYLHHSAPIAEALSNPRLISTTKVIQNFENPKIELRF